MAAADTWVGDRWDGTIWNNRLEKIFEIEWAEVNGSREGWYIDLDEAARIGHIQRERYLRRSAARREELGDAYKSIALRWLKKQPKMKTAKLSDIEKVERCWSDSGKRSIQITAKGKRYTLR